VRGRRSPEGGNPGSTRRPRRVDRAPTVSDDKESITADPNNSSDVYAVWDRGRLPSDKAGPSAAIHSFAFRSDVMFSDTTNGGTSWSTARAIFHPKANQLTIGNQIAVEPDGTLVDVFAFTQGSGNQPNGNSKASIAVIRSTDDGATWSDPIIVGENVPVGVVDPETGVSLRTGSGLPDIAVDMD